MESQGVGLAWPDLSSYPHLWSEPADKISFLSTLPNSMKNFFLFFTKGLLLCGRVEGSITQFRTRVAPGGQQVLSEATGLFMDHSLVPRVPASTETVGTQPILVIIAVYKKA